MDWIYMGGTLLRDLRTNRVRRLLSILGVVIGTAAVISSLAVVEGGREQLRRHLEKMGVNMVFLEDRFRPPPVPMFNDVFETEQQQVSAVEDPRPSNVEKKIIAKSREAQGVMTETGGTDDVVPTPGVLRMRDVAALRTELPEAALIEPVAIEYTEVGRVGMRPRVMAVEGATARGAEIRNLVVGEGRYLLPSDIERTEQVCVLGARMAQELFKGASAIGQRLTLLNGQWRVVGVLAPKGTMMRFDYDRLIQVPISSMHERTGLEMVNALLVQARDNAAALDLRDKLHRKVMDRLRGREPEEIRVFCQQELIEQHAAMLRTFRLLTISVAAFSLLVSGVGIMNIMLVSVRERTREIGIWKAVGATDNDVLTHFLAESVLTCAIGGALGILLGLLLASKAAGYVAHTVAETSGWSPVFLPVFFWLSLGTSVVVGLVSGLFPALVAARLEPTEALRHE